MAILVIGAIAVAGVVVWALTRTVEPASVMSTETPVADATTSPGFNTATVPVTTAPPTQTSTAPIGRAPDLQVPPATATQAPPPSAQGDRSEVRRIAVEDLRAQMNRGEVTIIDVRDAASFAAAHIPGAVNIPFASIEAQIDAIPKGKPIVTYCT